MSDLLVYRGDLTLTTEFRVAWRGKYFLLLILKDHELSVVKSEGVIIIILMYS